MKIVACRVNHIENPIGYEMQQPVFSWVVEDAKGKKQTEARIVIKNKGEIVHDTNWANLNSLATQIPIELKEKTRYTWCVTVKTDENEEATSEENFFETGKQSEVWEAKWISCSNENPRLPIFTKEINPQKQVVNARLYVCGLGLYEVQWNKNKIGKEFFAPYCNNYEKWLQVQTYDVTENLQENGVLYIILGNGWYKGRFGYGNRQNKGYYGDNWALIAQVHIEYADNTTQVIATDETWSVERSNISFSNIYDGEHCDDTLEPCEIEKASVLTESEIPKGKLTQRLSPEVVANEVFKPTQIIKTPLNETVLDIGQNMAGIFSLHVNVPKGEIVRLQFGEILQNDCFYRDNLRTAKAEYVYISNGKPKTIMPKFTYYGYRYVKIEGVPNLQPQDFKAIALYSKLNETGEFTCGDKLINRLVENTRWGQKSNFLDVPTDCPQRDERMGWTGDAQVFSKTACYQMDSYAFFAKYLHDIYTEQQNNNGAVPNVVPSFGKKECSAAWGDAACVIAFNLYEFYGDKTILQNQYASMCAWVDYIEKAGKGWETQFHFGDWLALDAPQSNDNRGNTDISFIANTQYYHSLKLTEEAAKILGKEKDYERYSKLSSNLLEYIQKEYFTQSGRCAVASQTGLLLALKHELSPNLKRTEQELKEKFKKDGGQLKTGFVGTPILCPVLTKAGCGELAYSLLLNEEYPSWLYAVKLGATTIWERWNSVLPDGSISSTGMNSLNHYAYGSIVEWLYSDVAGVKPQTAGFKSALLKPCINPCLGKVKASYASAAGKWSVEWQVLENGNIKYFCNVPFDCTAKVVLPYGGGEHNISSGDFCIEYTPNKSLITKFTIDLPLETLMRNSKVKALLIKAMPQIESIPQSLEAMSIREISSKMGTNENSSQLDQLDKLLAQF